MKKVFISMPMKGKTDEEIIMKRKEYAEACSKIIREDVEVIDSFFMGQKDDPVKMLSKAIELMSEADYVFFAADWRDARGCRCEHQIACAYFKNTITEFPSGTYQMFMKIGG